LDHFNDTGIQTLILGCTHYPLFKEIIPQILKDKNVKIIDSAESIAASAKQKLGELDLLNKDGGNFHCYVSDRPQRFHELAERFLGKELTTVDVVSLEK
jgi:glutamate racemase